MFVHTLIAHICKVDKWKHTIDISNQTNVLIALFIYYIFNIKIKNK